MRALLFLTVTLVWLASQGGLRAETAFIYQAVNWDKEMTLPPDTYRAPRPIEINGEFTVRTQPGTLIDGVSFLGRSGAQHWEITGTQMRRCRIGGQLGVNVHGVDSVFEDCEGSKDSGWFVAWWSSRWKYENCIFTKRFVRDGLSPTDYSARAVRCTFYGIKLPAIGFKEDPAKYLQGDDMGFERCRFVECDVPETVLAATHDCLFEHCRFAPRGQLKWPKETGPIAVTAFYTGLDNEPVSFTNGPLRVQFQSTMSNTGFGSTLPHTQSGTRITLTGVRYHDQFVAMGTVSRKASEITEAAPTAPAAPGASPRAPIAAVPKPPPTAVAAPTAINSIFGTSEFPAIATPAPTP